MAVDEDMVAAQRILQPGDVLTVLLNEAQQRGIVIRRAGSSGSEGDAVDGSGAEAERAAAARHLHRRTRRLANGGKQSQHKHQREENALESIVHFRYSLMICSVGFKNMSGDFFHRRFSYINPWPPKSLYVFIVNLLF